jgi:hypothetical protein
MHSDGVEEHTRPLIEFVRRIVEVHEPWLKRIVGVSYKISLGGNYR